MAEPKKTVLIVDDDEDTRTYLATLLEDNGYATISATDGQEGLEKARAEHPDLILLDLMMPGQTGTDLYRKLVKDKALGKTIVVIVSGTAGSHLAVKNPAAVLQKPVSPEDLLKTVSGLLPID